MIEIKFKWNFKLIIFLIFIIFILSLFVYYKVKDKTYDEFIDELEKIDKTLNNNKFELDYSRLRGIKKPQEENDEQTTHGKNIDKYESDYLVNGKLTDNNSGANEEFAREILQNLFNKPFPKVRPEFLKNIKTGRNLELDGYNEELKLAFEYNGIQHYQYPNFTGQSYEDFQKQKIRDKMKIDRCDDKGIYVIIIPYHVKPGRMREFIISRLPRRLRK